MISFFRFVKKRRAYETSQLIFCSETRRGARCGRKRLCPTRTVFPKSKKILSTFQICWLLSSTAWHILATCFSQRSKRNPCPETLFSVSLQETVWIIIDTWDHLRLRYRSTSTIYFLNNVFLNEIKECRVFISQILILLPEFWAVSVIR